MDIETIKEVVKNTTEMNITDPAITSVRKREYVVARMYYYGLCREYTTFSLNEIGRTLRPSKDHATVLHGIRSLKKEMSYNKTVQAEYTNLRSRIEFIKQKKEKENISFAASLHNLQIMEAMNGELIEENKKLLLELNDLKDKIKKQNKYLEEQGYKTNMNRTTKI